MSPNSPPKSRPSSADKVRRTLLTLREEMLAMPNPEGVCPHYEDSARNLMHYLALRRHDLRSLQEELATLGLSSLGRAESHVLASVDAVLSVLDQLCETNEMTGQEVASVDFKKGTQLLEAHTNALLGTPPADRDVRIMVTMPTEAATDYGLVRDLLRQGMGCMRINCAHDEPVVWEKMITNLRQAESELNRSCRVVMDLGGPKVRTGGIIPGPRVIRVRPRRGDLGEVLKPARVWLTCDDQVTTTPSDAKLLVDSAWLKGLGINQKVEFRDARDAHRSMTIVEISPDGALAELTKSAYFVPGTSLKYDSENGHVTTLVGDIPSKENSLTLKAGDTLIVTRNQEPGQPAIYDPSGALLVPARIGCTLPEIFNDVRPGDPIWFDDGKIGGVITTVDQDQVTVSITQTRVAGGRLRADKGINLPETHLRLDALTHKDIEDLNFVAEHADVVELSFANCARDVEMLQDKIKSLGDKAPAIVLKIETRRGFENLPEMILAAMKWPVCGVMIARGDLAVECGFERLAEVQEEILWICEAAHIPVIWATQVLETLSKEGMPSRAEISDAAMGNRAECVMLNKGPHMVNAVRVLDDILRRMQTHQTKKQSMMRELHLAHALD